jgi:hypothetical protein
MSDPHALENLEFPSTPIPEAILRWNGSHIVKNGKVTTDAETQTLIASAQALTANPFYQLLIEDLCRAGYSQMTKAKDWDAVQFGKACLYIADIAKKKVQNAANLPIPKSRPLAKPIDEEDDR